MIGLAISITVNAAAVVVGNPAIWILDLEVDGQLFNVNFVETGWDGQDETLMYWGSESEAAIASLAINEVLNQENIGRVALDSDYLYFVAFDYRLNISDVFEVTSLENANTTLATASWSVSQAWTDTQSLTYALWHPASEVPIPAAAWLFGSALLGLGALKRRRA
jgi:hypothetical protein